MAVSLSDRSIEDSLLLQPTWPASLRLNVIRHDPCSGSGDSRSILLGISARTAYATQSWNRGWRGDTVADYDVARMVGCLCHRRILTWQQAQLDVGSHRRQGKNAIECCARQTVVEPRSGRHVNSHVARPV
jgi:hypothetical protein